MHGGGNGCAAASAAPVSNSEATTRTLAAAARQLLLRRLAHLKLVMASGSAITRIHCPERDGATRTEQRDRNQSIVNGSYRMRSSGVPATSIRDTVARIIAGEPQTSTS
jgi:hypothetical protein